MLNALVDESIYIVKNPYRGMDLQFSNLRHIFRVMGEIWREDHSLIARSRLAQIPRKTSVVTWISELLLQKWEDFL